jgi:hypothetical protein
MPRRQLTCWGHKLITGARVTRTDEARTAPPALRSWLMKGVSEDP